MDRIESLRRRQAALLEAGKRVRADISSLVDEDSFVELSAFGVSSKSIDGEDTCGDGVVTGFATIGGYPFYIVAQNFAESYGGLTKHNCEKIAKTLQAAEKNNTPVVYLMHSQGVRLGEASDVLEGVAELLLKVTQLKGTVMQYAVICGEVYGSNAVLASLCDVIFFLKEGALCMHSPLVLAAKANKTLSPQEAGGIEALKGAVLPTVPVVDIKEVAGKIVKITELLSIDVTDAELNAPAPSLNTDVSSETLLRTLFDESVELGAASCPNVKTVLGRIGGISVATAVLDGVKLDVLTMKKIKNFAELACCYGVPFVTFVDCTGVEPSLAVNDSSVLKEIGEYLNILDAIDTAKIAVITGKAVGLGYSLFAAKSVGFDYTYALATAQIALFENAETAKSTYGGCSPAEKEKMAWIGSVSGEEACEPLRTACAGYLDGVIEPQFLRQYLIASLQTLVR